MRENIMSKPLMVKTIVTNNFKYLARDLNGAVYVFENKPSLATDIACDTWDVKTGEVLEITKPLAEEVSSDYMTEELGDWRESLIEIS
tara:strand:- start:464 stop:727 length:264 start_codon:yes stop_codon:yes gene_type:complete